MTNSKPAELPTTRELQSSVESTETQIQAADYQVGGGDWNKLSQPKSTEALPALTITGLEDGLEPAASRNPGDNAIAHERTELLDLARQSSMSPEQLTTFQNNLNRFEQRVENNPQEIVDTYNQIDRLFKAGGASVVGSTGGAQIAFEVLNQAADPRSIQQGNGQTCAVASLESRIYARHPSAAAELVADASLDGSYRGRQIDHQSIASYQYPNFPTNETERSYASQVFQITAANVFQRLNPDSEPNAEYILTPAQPGRIRMEALVNNQTGAFIANNPKIEVTDGETLRQLNNLITGTNEEPFVINLPENPTEQDFRATLDRLNATGNYPALLAIRADSDLVQGSSEGSISHHIVALEPGADQSHVFINNQTRGKAGDYEVSVTDAFNGMRMNDDLAANATWVTRESVGIHSLQDLANRETLPTDVIKNLQNSILQYKPEHIRAIESAYQGQYNESISTFLTDDLKLSDQQMERLGFEHSLFSGWSLKD